MFLIKYFINWYLKTIVVDTNLGHKDLLSNQVVHYSDTHLELFRDKEDMCYLHVVCYRCGKSVGVYPYQYKSVIEFLFSRQFREIRILNKESK